VPGERCDRAPGQDGDAHDVPGSCDQVQHQEEQREDEVSSIRGQHHQNHAEQRQPSEPDKPCRTAQRAGQSGGCRIREHEDQADGDHPHGCVRIRRAVCRRHDSTDHHEQGEPDEQHVQADAQHRENRGEHRVIHSGKPSQRAAGRASFESWLSRALQQAMVWVESREDATKRCIERIEISGLQGIEDELAHGSDVSGRRGDNLVESFRREGCDGCSSICWGWRATDPTVLLQPGYDM
jgi:hypothetical protein